MTDNPLLISAIRKTNARIALADKLYDEYIKSYQIARAEAGKRFGEGSLTFAEHKKNQHKFQKIIKMCRVYRYKIVFGGDRKEYEGLMKDLTLTADEREVYREYNAKNVIPREY